MPTYAYRCASCEHAFEQYQAFTDDSLTDCPACGESSLRKVFNSIGVTFNGSGFYRTDSRGTADASKKSPEASGTKSSDAAGSSSSGKPPSTPAPAAASTPA
ncbi:FmdB family transcriptional regulator [Salinibacterium sp. dk2585]|uniref:FmdB family zinc ribbon protein n=1 Tax=unclassified Salinibacterium TaxID=2632331 RepID=UPI0011C2538E|nr:MULTISPECIES: FmdB family zinc ribbon protein [unclassified Salinibacterium]QEE62090.1 FmdB family transcriptional regulator [Salinibacterium sp. dk2585]TXK53442.1 FmdB family transcriptional regulator [Salinibacterium sp. dk5596]